MARAASVIIVATSERHPDSAWRARQRSFVENDEGTAHFNPYLVGLATILQEMSMAFEPVKSPEDRIIFVWPIALRAHASPARSAEFGLSSDRKTNSCSAKKSAQRSVLHRSVAKSLNSKPARVAFSKSRCRFSSAVTSIVRNCKRQDRSRIFFRLLRSVCRSDFLDLTPEAVTNCRNRDSEQLGDFLPLVFSGPEHQDGGISLA